MKDTLTLDHLLAVASTLRPAPAPLRFFIVPTWVREERWVFIPPRRCPPRGRRWGTRRLWKRRFNIRTGWQRRVVPVEPDHMMRLADGTVYCTERQYSALKAATGSVAP